MAGSLPAALGAGGRRRWGGARGRAWRGLVLGLAMAAFAPALDAVAANIEFMGVAVEPLSGIYVVVKDVNVRSAPASDADKVAQAGVGTELEAAGKVKGGWVAVRRGGRDLGFVFESYLKAVKQAPLERDKAGRIVGAGGKPVAPASGRFLAVAETVVRAKPAANATKNGQIERGTRVEAMGASGDGKWLAVRWSGREMGFVPREALLPLIDGNLLMPVNGKAALAGGGTCGFSIRFTGKTPVEDDIIETADYDMDWRCEVEGRKLNFPGFMFITEAPFQLSDNQVYQISVDLLDVARDYDEIFSTVFLYRRAESKIVFDGVSVKDLGATPTNREAPATSVAEALAAAAALAPTAWGGDVWKMLAEPVQ
ncbi:SH3 domain-containing protein [Shumkonia mesophila]|uniref:SH3 domain-containing protein n=1 Tax=Shumkonia mesophila TaxID=2838854 RepID=UPI002934F5A7|nr:SH3 domain-containing protein [Shumkonia mesophila]